MIHEKCDGSVRTARQKSEQTPVTEGAVPISLCRGYSLVVKSCACQPRLAEQELETKNHASNAERQSCQQTQQDQNVPGRTVPVQPGQVPGVEPMIEPAVPAGAMVVSLHQSRGLGIDIERGTGRVVQA